MKIRTLALLAISAVSLVSFADEAKTPAPAPSPSPSPTAAAPAKPEAKAVHRHSFAPLPEFIPCSPETEPTRESEKLVSSFAKPGERVPSSLPQLDFCSEWNPEFPFNGHHCCRAPSMTHTRRARRECYSHRPHGGYCGEVTDDQKDYTDKVESGKIADVLEDIDVQRRTPQAYCTVNNGFLAYGRRLIPSARNRVELKDSSRCTEFGTDSMIGMLEWTGRQVANQYASPEYGGVKLVIGDVAAPRGGCLAGSSGRVGHLSHTSGQDVDVGYLSARAKVRSPSSFIFDFDAKSNWWLAKQILTNPYACVKVIFLDRRNIRKLKKIAKNDPDWGKFGRFFRHMPGHKNHMHVRIGDAPGKNGCVAHPELEEGEDGGAVDGDELGEGIEEMSMADVIQTVSHTML